MLDLARDQLGEALPQADRRHQQLVVVRLPRVAGQEVEHLGHVVEHARIGGEQPEVGVDLRRGAVVVAGADVHVAADAVGFLADDQAQLAVRLQVLDAVDDVHAGILQPRRPLDVVPLVEPRLQLDQHGDLLPGVGGVDQQVDQRRVRADPVQRHLDADHVRIGRPPA